MPHFGLMDSENMSSDQAALLRAKLHIRGGKRRFSQGKFVAGVAAFHDALIHAMQWYIIISKKDFQEFLDNVYIDLTDDQTLLSILREKNVLDASYDDSFDFLANILDQALCNKIVNFDQSRYMKILHSFMDQLGVTPFSESELPPEDPSTY